MKIRIEDWRDLEDDLNLDDLEFSEKINKRKADKSHENTPARDKYKKVKRKNNASSNTTEETE